VFSFSAPFYGFGELWEVSPGRPDFTQKLPLGHDATDVAVSRSGARLAYVQGLTNVNIWRLDLLASPPRSQKLVVVDDHVKTLFFEQQPRRASGRLS